MNNPSALLQLNKLASQKIKEIPWIYSMYYTYHTAPIKNMWNFAYLFEELLVELVSNSIRSEDGDRQERERQDKGEYVAAGAGPCPCNPRNSSSAASIPATQLEILGSGAADER